MECTRGDRQSIGRGVTRQPVSMEIQHALHWKKKVTIDAKGKPPLPREETRHAQNVASKRQRAKCICVLCMLIASETKHPPARPTARSARGSNYYKPHTPQRRRLNSCPRMPDACLPAIQPSSPPDHLDIENKINQKRRCRLMPPAQHPDDRKSNDGNDTTNETKSAEKQQHLHVRSKHIRYKAHCMHPSPTHPNPAQFRPTP